MKLTYSREIRNQISRLHPCENPYLGKPLVRELQGFWSIPHQRYRIAYEIDTDSNQCQIYALGPRRDVYRDFAKKLPMPS